MFPPPTTARDRPGVHSQPRLWWWCVPEICPADTVIGPQPDARSTTAARARTTAPATRTCEDETTGNYTCTGGTCNCEAEECAAGTKVPHDGTASSPTAAVTTTTAHATRVARDGSTSNDTCKDGTCSCDPKITCPDDKKVARGKPCTFRTAALTRTTVRARPTAQTAPPATTHARMALRLQGGKMCGRQSDRARRQVHVL